jgi:RNA polymerase sigma-70 factor (ECF subfamily)
MYDFNAELCELIPMLTPHARRYCKSQADAEDLVQQTVERALVYSHSYKPGTNMKAWVTFIMRNLYINSWNKHVRTLKMHERLEGEPRKKAEKPDAGDNERDAQKLLDTLEASLTPVYFATLKLCAYEGKSYLEIADILDIPIGTVMSRLHRARKKARETLLEFYGPEMLNEFAADVVATAK